MKKSDLSECASEGMKERPFAGKLDLVGDEDGTFSLFLVCESVDLSRCTGRGSGRDMARALAAMMGGKVKTRGSY